MTTIDEKIKASKQKLGEKIPCSIEVLTPVHIGSGVKLTEGIDFIKNNSSVHIIPQSTLLRYLEENPEERDNFINGGYRLSALNNIPEGNKYNISIGRTSEINEFERSGNGKPYIPGSSIKGSIRTILLKKRFDALQPSEQSDLLKKVTSNRKEWASEPVMKALFGDTSNENLMRILEIFDAEFDILELEKVIILSLTNESGTSYGWKQLWNRQNTNDYTRASQIIAEALPIGSKGYFSFQLGSFLLNDTTAKEKLKFIENSFENIYNLRKLINEYSTTKLLSEKSFFEKLKSPKPLTSVINEIDVLIEKIKKLSDDEFIMRLSWGSGWKGMTGDYLDANWLNKFRSKYRLGKNGFSVFPKTRRIVFEDNEPKYLTGWIKVKLYETKPQHKEVNTSGSINENQNIDSSNWAAILGDKFIVKNEKKKK